MHLLVVIDIHDKANPIDQAKSIEILKE